MSLKDDDKRQKVFELRREGYSYEVIARILQISRGAAHSVIQRIGHDPLVTRTPAPSWVDMSVVHRVRRKPKISWQKEREAVRLRTLGFSFRAISEKLQINVNSVRSILRRLPVDPIVRPAFSGSTREFLEFLRARKAGNSRLQ